MIKILWILVIISSSAMANEISLDVLFQSADSSDRVSPWNLTPEEESYILEQLGSNEAKVIRDCLFYVRKFEINTVQIRKRLANLLGEEFSTPIVFGGDFMTSLDHESCVTLEKIYDLPRTPGLRGKERIIDLKKKLNKHPDFEGRFTEELANREQSERKPLERSDSSSETSTGVQSVDTPQKSSIDNPRSFAWLYWILSVLILSGVGVLVWKNRKGSSTR